MASLSAAAAANAEDEELEDPINDEKEKEHFRQVVESFRLYNFYASKRVANRLKNYEQLSVAHKSYLFDFEENCKKLIDCIKSNDRVIDLFLRDVDHMFENTSRDVENEKEKKSSSDLKAHEDVDRVYTTLKQIARDWSADGEKERAACYGPILDELRSIYAHVEPKRRNQIRVLVPGAGLGRLAFEIAALGFNSQGNEFSLHMLIVSNFILNNQIREVRFPDVSPRDRLTESFSFAAGDFMDVYTEPNSWDSVVTCFFVDTAHNIIDYVEKIWHILKPNGYWINLGPLLYHFNDMPNEMSIELSYEQLKRVIQSVGFVYLKENLNMTSTYLENVESMLKYSYECVFFVTKKPSSL